MACLGSVSDPIVTSAQLVTIKRDVREVDRESLRRALERWGAQRQETQRGGKDG